MPPRLDILQTEFARELEHKASLEQRGITVITASGALTTLVFGFSALLTKGTSFGNFDLPEKVALAIALASFVTAAVFGVSANIPRPMGQIRSGSPQFERDLSEPPARHGRDDPRRYFDPNVWRALVTGEEPEILAEEIADAISATKKANSYRAQSVRIATTLQTLAILAIGVAVIFIIFLPPVH